MSQAPNLAMHALLMAWGIPKRTQRATIHVDASRVTVECVFVPSDDNGRPATHPETGELVTELKRYRLVPIEDGDAGG
jgi:hypothetical protein